MIEIGKNYYYVGVGIKEWENQPVKVIKDTGDKIGTNRDISVYVCEDENLKVKRVAETNLSLKQSQYNYVYRGMGECFPKNVDRFPTFKNGRYTCEYTWGKY